jgi:2-C-methyl-D-erythritol 4-phosphate cytidylyltransferase
MAASGRLTGAAILVAAGSGERLGAGVPKAFVTVAGATLLEHAASRFASPSRLLQSADDESTRKPVNSLQESGDATALPRITAVVVVAPADHLGRAASLTGLPTVAGGATRQESVAAGLAAVPGDVDLVLVHDVARPFVPTSVIDAVLAALAAGADAVVPTVPIHDTVRRVDAAGVLGGLVDRSTLAAIQTPQGFRREVLASAHAQGAGITATDDAALVELLGVRVVAVPGSDDAFKITTAADLVRAEALATGDTPGHGLG